MKMMDKTFSSKSSSSSSSLALKAETTKSVVTFLSLSLFPFVVAKTKSTNKSQKSRFFVSCVRDERERRGQGKESRGMVRRKETKRERKREPSRIFVCFFARKQNSCRLFFLPFFLLSLRRRSLAISCWGEIRILISFFSLFFERELAGERREKGKRLLYIIASSSNRFPRFRRRVLRVRVRVRERAHLDLSLFAAA